MGVVCWWVGCRPIIERPVGRPYGVSARRVSAPVGGRLVGTRYCVSARGCVSARRVSAPVGGESAAAAREMMGRCVGGLGVGQSSDGQ